MADANAEASEVIPSPVSNATTSEEAKPTEETLKENEDQMKQEETKAEIVDTEPKEGEKLPEGEKSQEGEKSHEGDGKEKDQDHSEKEAKPKVPGSPSTQHKEKTKDELTDKERKARIEEIRKKKIGDYKKKEDDRRKAVLERKKRLEDEERAKNEALMKKLATSSTPPKRPASAPARRAVSFSSLSHLHKTHAVAKEINIEGKAQRSKETGDQSSSTAPVGERRRTLPQRPASAMERKKTSSLSHEAPAKSSTDAAAKPSRPRSAFGRGPETKTRQSISNLPPRPSSAAANKPPPKISEERLKALSAPKSRPSMPALPAKPLVPVTKTREMKKATSAGNILHKATHERPKGPIQPGKKTPESADKTKPKTEHGAAATAKTTTVTKTVTKTTTVMKTKETGKKPGAKTHTSEKVEVKHEKVEHSKDGAKKAGPSNEEQAKKLLAEKRRQVKEEAERKALEEKGKAEEARKKLEEEQRIRAEELAREQERQKQHLEELQREAEERERKAQEEKERKEQEERELIEAQKRQRQEDIDRKAQEEVERRAKEREVKRQQEEADRIERKKRVQEILGSRIRGSPAAEGATSPTPMSPANNEERSGEKSPPMIDSAASARDKVQKLLEKNQRKSNDSQSSLDGDEENTLEEAQGIEQTSVANSTTYTETKQQGTEHVNGDNQLDDLLFEPESSLKEADMQALRDLEQEQRAKPHDTEADDEAEAHNETEAGNAEIVKNGTVDGECSLNNNTANNAGIQVEGNAKKDEVDKLWNEAEKIMAENEDSNLNKSIDSSDVKKQNDTTPASGENRLWLLAEGRMEIDLEECF